MAGDAFRLSPLVKLPGCPKNISIFLQSLAKDRQKRAIAVILSGFDSDGAAALEPIKEAGGLVFAQKFQTASQPDMPQSAIKTGCVDQLLSPADIAVELGRIGKERALIKNGKVGSPSSGRSLCRAEIQPWDLAVSRVGLGFSPAPFP
jgi:chemotaxis response regulator CheB